MKTLLFYICTFVLVSFVIGSRKLSDAFDNGHYNACLTENNASDNDMLTMQDIIHDRHKQSENQEKINKNGCIMQCLFQKAGVMEGSEYDVEKMHIDFTKKTNAQPGSKMFAALDNCINETKDFTEKCEKSFALIECFVKAEHEINFSSGNNEEHGHEHEKDHLIQVAEQKKQVAERQYEVVIRLRQAAERQYEVVMQLRQAVERQPKIDVRQYEIAERQLDVAVSQFQVAVSQLKVAVHQYQIAVNEFGITVRQLQLYNLRKFGFSLLDLDGRIDLTRLFQE